jgi:hypothetical protein
VALALAARPRTSALQAWIVDSTPERKTPDGSAWTMLEVVRALPARLGSRTELIDPIVRAGFSVGVAQWMGTNLVREEDGFVWRLDFDVMEQLLHDFFTTDAWALVEAPPAYLDLHFLKASASNAISPAAVERITAATGPRVHLHHRDGGHWIHAESPGVVTALIVEHLP